jgi:hypothetical protein
MFISESETAITVQSRRSKSSESQLAYFDRTTADLRLDDFSTNEMLRSILKPIEESTLALFVKLEITWHVVPFRPMFNHPHAFCPYSKGVAAKHPPLSDKDGVSV